MSVLLSALLALASASPAADPQSLRDLALKEGAVEEIVLIDHKPLELTDLTSGSDVVAEVAVKSERSFITSDGGQIWTDYHVEILTPLRSSPSLAAGASLIVRRRGGTMQIEAKTIRSIENGFPPFRVGDQYVLFLRKMQEGLYRVTEGPYGAFAIANGSVNRAVTLSEFRDSVAQQRQAGASATRASSQPR